MNPRAPELDDDDLETCHGCGERFDPSDLNGVSGWGEARLCDDCFQERPASRGRDPDDRGYDR